MEEQDREEQSAHRGALGIEEQSAQRNKLQMNSGHRETLQDTGTQNTNERTQRSNGYKGTWALRSSGYTEEQRAQRNTLSYK